MLDRILNDFHRLADEEIVTIEVGATKTNFHIHKKLLCDVSPFFRAGFSGRFKEGSDKSMRLSEDDVDTFQRFVSWLYTKKYGLSGFETEPDVEERYMQLASLYVLSDKFGIGSLKNEMIDHLFSMRLTTDINAPPQSAISLVYANSVGGSAFRKLLVEWYVWHIEGIWYTNPRVPGILAEVPDFAAELAVAFGQRIANPKQRSLFEGDSSALYEDANTGSDDTRS